MDLESPALKRIQFVRHKVVSHRRHYVTEEDVKIVLSRLPEELWSRLRKVHFKDDARGNRRLGYTTTRGRREISLCALPSRVSLNRAEGTPEAFGALRGSQWPVLAVRRFMLYDVLLHEIGHLQTVLPESKNPNRKFASETKAQKFANEWRGKLWSEHYDHPDPVHNAPNGEELRALRTGWIQGNLAYKRGQALARSGHPKEAAEEYRKAIELYPSHALALQGLGRLTWVRSKTSEGFSQANQYLRQALAVDPMLPEANLYLALTLSYLGQETEARKAFEAAIRLDPFGDLAMREFADALSAWGRNDEAEALFKKLNTSEPDHFLTLKYLAFHLMRRRAPPTREDLTEAVRLLRRVLVLWPGHADNYSWLAFALSQLEGCREEATQCALEAIRLDPGDQRAAELLAKLTPEKPQETPRVQSKG